MTADQRRLSARAAEEYARKIGKGPPPHARLVPPACAVTVCAAAGAVAVSFAAAAALAALALLLLAIVVEDRRSAWRYVPEPPQPARILPPRPRSSASADAAVPDLPRPSGPVPTPPLLATPLTTTADLPSPRVVEHRSADSPV